MRSSDHPDGDGGRDWLDAILAADAPPAPDAAFTATILDRLPPPRATRRRRTAVLSLAAGLAAAVAFLALPGGEILPGAIADVFSPARASLASLASVAVVASLVWGAIAAARAEA